MTQPDDRNFEAPEADAAEQAAYADPTENDYPARNRLTISDGVEVPEWDALEQAQVVPDEDDYR